MKSLSTPKPFDTGHAYRTATWVTHYAVAAAVILGLVSMGLMGVILALFPLKEVRPMLVTTHSKSEQIVQVEPLKLSKEATKLLIEALVRQYVMLREPIDLQSEPHRWGKILKFSSDPLAKAFYNLYKKENPKSPFKKFQDQGITRSVILKTSACLAPSAPDVWQVEWESIDHKGDQEIGRARWVSTLTVGLTKKEVSYEDQYLNPIGFEVRHYAVSRKE